VKMVTTLKHLGGT